jgi:hypothetical protein
MAVTTVSLDSEEGSGSGQIEASSWGQLVSWWCAIEGCVTNTMRMHTNQSKLTESAAIDPVQLVHPADGNMASAMATTTCHGGVASILTQIACE